MKRMIIGLLFATLATNAFAYYNPGQGRWLSRDPIGEPGFAVATTRQQPGQSSGLRGQGRWLSRDPMGAQALTVVQDGKVKLKRENPTSADQINLYAFVRNSAINHFDPLGLTVYLVHVPAAIPLVDHRMIVGDDGKGGSYVIDFGPRGGGCNRICGPGTISHFANPKESAWDQIRGMTGVEVKHWVLTTDRVDTQLAQDAKDWYQNAEPPSFIVGFRDCNQFAWSWIRWARFLQDQDDQIIWLP